LKGANGRFTPQGKIQIHRTRNSGCGCFKHQCVPQVYWQRCCGRKIGRTNHCPAAGRAGEKFLCVSICLHWQKSAFPKSKFSEVRKLFSSDFSKFHDAITEIVGSNNWCGISVKNYINEEAQISTNYAIRDLCEKEFGAVERIYDNATVVQKMFDAVVNLLSYETILFLNSFPATSNYQIALFDPKEIRITEIEFKKLAKHTRFIFLQNGSPVFHVKYGKNQANPYQRGLWVDDLSKLTILRKGKFRDTMFGDYILDGAFRIHPSARNL
jgi:hypothetical protein